jgi:ribonuclease VapC
MGRRQLIIDSSAVIAILLDEPELAVFTHAIERASSRRVSAATYLEIGVVLDARRRQMSYDRLDEFVRRSRAIIEPVTEAQARLARDAHRRYGRGSGHRARLNFGDCFAYALARDKDEPLLFKGTDFGSTDVRVAV